MIKRLFTSIVAVLVGVTTGASVPVYADTPAPVDSGVQQGAGGNVRDPNTLRVYYSESLGAGEKVYHLTTCQKGAAFQPVTCNDLNADKYVGQCKSGNDVLYGQKIKGCLMENGQKVPKIKDGEVTTTYDKVDPKTHDDCKGDQGFFYGRTYIVFEIDKAANPPINVEEYIKEPHNSIAKIAWEGDADPTSDEIRKIVLTKEDLETNQNEFKAVKGYQITQCVSGDVLDVNGDSSGTPQAADDVAEAKLNSNMASLRPMINAGCNNDNTARSLSLDGLENPIPRSTILDSNPTFTCNTYERITGKSGTDLIARYTGAIYRWGAGIGGIISVFVIVLSGVQMIVGGGDQGAVDKAKERITQSLMGLVLLFLSALILYTINPTFFTP